MISLLDLPYGKADLNWLLEAHQSGSLVQYGIQPDQPLAIGPDIIMFEENDLNDVDDAIRSLDPLYEEQEREYLKLKALKKAMKTAANQTSANKGFFLMFFK